MKRALVGLIVVVVMVAAGGLWWTGRSDAPAALDIDDVGAGSTAGASVDPTELTGTWTVATGPDTVAGMRIAEERAGALPDHTAVGRTGQVAGTLEVADGRVTSATFAVDLASIEFTDDPGLPVADRSEYLRTRALETDRFPEATFSLTEPLPLPAFDDAGTASAVPAQGTLTLHGVTRPIELLVDVRTSADRVVLATSDPVAVRLPDHEIEPPEITGLATVSDEGSFEFVVVLRRA